MKSYAILFAAVAVMLLPFSAMAEEKAESKTETKTESKSEPKSGAKDSKEQKECLPYEPGEAKLRGVLHRLTAVWTVDLEKPVCLDGRDNDKTGMYPNEDAVTTAVLVFHQNMMSDKYLTLVDKKVEIVGTLYHKYDNSSSQVMVTVSRITPIKLIEENAEHPKGTEYDGPEF